VAGHHGGKTQWSKADHKLDIRKQTQREKRKREREREREMFSRDI
jgi:hypothetical protein